MNMAFKYLGTFLSAAIVAVGVGAVTDASAWWVRTHASDCLTLGGAPLDVNFAIYNDSTTSTMQVLCPATDTSAMPKQATAAMNVHGFDDHSSQNVATLSCRSSWNTNGGSCQTGPSSSGLGNYGLTIPTDTVWTAGTAADFGYFWVSLPVKQGSAFRSSLRGAFQSN